MTRTSATLERTRGRPRTARTARTAGAVLALTAMFGVLDLAGAPPFTTADVAACDAVSIPSLDLERCVVDGGQGVIDAGGVARYTALSSASVHWLAGHRTSHGGTFGTLPGLRVGALVHYRDRTYVVVDYRLVNRYQPDAVADWIYSTTPSVVLQTSASSAMVHVWRSVEFVPVAPIVAVAPPPVPG